MKSTIIKLVATAATLALLITVTAMAAIEFTKPTEQELKLIQEVAVRHCMCQANMANRGYDLKEINIFCGDVAPSGDHLTWK